jgi:proline dehydrogenase
MSLSLITAAEQFAKAIKQVDYAIEYFDEQEMLDEVITAAKTSIVRLQSEDEDFEILVSNRDDMLEHSAGHNIIWGNADSNNALIDALFWINGAIDGEPTTFVVAGVSLTNGSVN